MAKNKSKKDALQPSADFISKIADQIAESPISDPWKAMFLYAIAQGTFSLSLYELFQKLLKEYRENLERDLHGLEEEEKRLQDEYQRATEQFPQAVFGATQEISAACEHIEKKAAAKFENIGQKKKTSEIEILRQKLKNKK